MTDEEILGLVNKLEHRIDTQEALIANLLQAYIEMWATLALLMEQMVGASSEEEQRSWGERYKEVRTKLWESFKEAGVGGVEGLDPDTANAVEHLLTGE